MTTAQVAADAVIRVTDLKKAYGNQGFIQYTAEVLTDPRKFIAQPISQGE